MSEIVHVQIGQHGNIIGTKFWEVIADEHGIGPTGRYYGDSDFQLKKINAYFNEAKYGQYVPRAIIMDIEYKTIDFIRASPFGQLFDPDSFIIRKEVHERYWRKGHNTEGGEVVYPTLDALRREAEKCDSLHGFQITHSLGGCTGGGMGTLLINCIRDEYPGRIIATFSMYSSMYLANSILNSGLFFNYLTENADLVQIIEFEPLYNICHDILKLSNPTYGDFYHLVSAVMSDVTSCIRFPSQFNTDFRKLAMNLVPFPRIHFLMTGFAPSTSLGTQQHQALTVSQLIEQVFDAKNMMHSCDPRNGYYLGCVAMFRGKVSLKEVDEEILNFQNKNSSSFIEWIPDNFKSIISDIPQKGLKTSVTLIQNSTAIHEVLKAIANRFESIIKREHFMYYSEEDGNDYDQLERALSTMNDLINEYQQYQSAADQCDPMEEYEGEEEEDEERYL